MKVLLQRSLVSACVVAAAFCFWKAWPGLVGESGPFDSRPAHASSRSLHQVHSDFAPPRMHLRTTSIQDLRVGMRVLGRNPVRAEADQDLLQPDPAIWRLVRVRMEHKPGKFVHAQLLRPVEWIEDTGAEVGSSIWLDLPEMFVEGEADVLSIAPCPPLESGTNPLITGTFQHQADELVEVWVAGLDEPITCTSQHPFWSETRQGFIAAERLHVGEEVLTAFWKSARITSISPRASPETVYGLEIYGEHVYHVGAVGLLVHNASEETTRIRHYTNRKGSNAIAEDEVIRAGEHNRVYAELASRKPLSPTQAEAFHQIPRGRGRDYVETDVPTERIEWIKNPRHGRFELTVEGDLPLINAEVVRRK